MRLIDHKKVDLTNDEYKMYEEICRSYDDERANRKGEDLFTDLFESNDDGVIIFVKPPRKKYSSLEVYCFLISVMQNQHMRILYEQNKALIKEASSKIKALTDKTFELQSKVEKLVEKVSD